MNPIMNWRRVTRFAAKVAVALATRVVPRTNAVWVVGGSKGLKYADNPMYFLKYCKRHINNRVVWLAWTQSVVDEVRADGYEAHRIGSMTGLWLGLRAKWHIFGVTPEDTGLTNHGAHLLNLWHGIPLKDIRVLKKRQTVLSIWSRLVRRILADMDRIAKTYFVHPTEFNIQYILEYFEIQQQNIIYANLPRNIAIGTDEAPRSWCKLSDLDTFDRLRNLAAQGTKLVGYFPTWRGDASDMFLGTLNPSDLARINEFLRKHDCYLLTKWHDCLYSAYKHPGVNVSAENLVLHMQQQSNFIVLDFDADLNSHLAHCDILVTDYSGVFFDYLLLDRPIIFFPYDKEEYERKWGFLFDYGTFVPGPIVRDLDTFLSLLAAWLSGNDPDYSVKRNKCRTTFFQHVGDPGVIIRGMQSISS